MGREAEGKRRGRIAGEKVTALKGGREPPGRRKGKTTAEARACMSTERERRRDRYPLVSGSGEVPQILGANGERLSRRSRGEGDPCVVRGTATSREKDLGRVLGSDAVLESSCTAALK